MNGNKRPLRFLDYVDWPEAALPFDSFDGEFSDYADEPFGEEIINPASRTIPAHFCGTWVPYFATGQLSDDGQPREFLTVEQGLIKEQGSSTHYEYPNQPVIAVRRISQNKIAVVSQSPEDNGVWNYSLRMFGVNEDGTRLYNLESTDITYYRFGSFAGPQEHLRYDLDGH